MCWLRSRYSLFLFLHGGVLHVNFSAKKISKCIKYKEAKTETGDENDPKIRGLQLI